MKKGCLSSAVGILLGLVILLAGAYLVLNREHTSLDAAARAGLPGKFVSLPQGVTHYLESGPADGPVVVLVHGFSVAAYTWDHTAPALAAAGFHVLAPDLFGRGYSDRLPGPYTLDLFTRQIDDFLTALKIDRPVELVGLSMGGYVTAGYAAQHPERVRRVALLAPQCEATGSDPRLAVVTTPLVGEYLFTVVIGPLVMSDSADEFAAGQQPPDWAGRYQDMMQYSGFRSALLSTLRNMTGDPFVEYDRLGRLGLPVLLLWGQDDTTVPFENAAALQAAIPQAEFHAIPNAKHAFAFERPEAVNPLLVAFLKK
jgi:pimeloyl-ACP methyl ester carboxylesterase